jgi:hypothetical protein
MLPSEQRPKITVEDLIRLKRAERPAPEFWVNFERELRQKQLTALLEKRPWWQELPQFFARRAYLPVGATAILAFTLVSVRYYTPAQLTKMDAAPATGSIVAAPSAGIPLAPVSVQESSPLVNRSNESAVRAEENNATVTPVVVESPAPARALIAVSSTVVPPATRETPSARYIATNLDRLGESDPELLQAVMGSRLSAPARGQTASDPLPELASVPTNSSKRSRILAQYSERPLNPAPTAPELVRERLARRLGDSEITDRISRIGLKGDQVSLGLTLRL